MSWEKSDLLCSDLSTTPRHDLGTVLVTGATGYIGGRLVPELLARGYTVRVMARVDTGECERRWPEAETVVADALYKEQLEKAVEGVDTAFYLIHPSFIGYKKYRETDLIAARNFREVASKAGIRRIIFLGTIIDQDSLKDTIQSKIIKIPSELYRGTVPLTNIRVAMIIGSGSAFYELVKYLVSRSPIILIPPWAKNKVQPISIRSLMHVLVGTLETEETAGKSFDICGDEMLTYEDMFRIYSEMLGKRKIYVKTFFNNLRLFSYFASLLTPLPESVIRSMIVRGRFEMICNNNADNLRNLYTPIKFRDSVLRAMSREERDAVHTRWSDEYPREHELAVKLNELSKPPRFISTYVRMTEESKKDLFRSFCKIGGDKGWLHSNWMWRLRGLLDRLLLGVGISRGRRSSSSLRLNDVIDFWRVEEIIDNQKLLLRAEMKLPGLAWLEFNIKGGDNGQRKLSVTAYYASKGIFGLIYWYIFLPFHHIIFTNLLKQIEIKAREMGDK